MTIQPVSIFLPPIRMGIVTSNTTAKNGHVYLADSTAGSFTISLPRPTQNHIISIKDFKTMFGTNNVTVQRFANEKIEGVASDYVLAINGDSIVFISDGTDWFIFAYWNSGLAAAVASSFAPFVAIGAIAANDTVYLSGTGSVSKGNVSGGGAPSQIIGVATQTVVHGATVLIQFDGARTGFAGLTPGARYFADPSVLGGVTTTTPATPGATIVQMGYARTAVSLGINIQQLGRVAS
jgi:hypothetical protein